MGDWLKINDLTFRYGQDMVFQDVSVSVAETHRIVAVVGASGIGKTTLLNLIAGFNVPTSGDIKLFDRGVDGRNITTPMVFQGHNLFPWKTVYGNVEFGLKARKVPEDARRKVIGDLMEKLGLGDRLGDFPRDLSGGMKQRVGLARALAVEPDCILMDEPFSALDYKTRSKVIDFFLGCLQDFDSHAMIVTHDLEEAAGIASCVIRVDSPQKIRVIEFTPKSWGEICGDPEELATRVGQIKKDSDAQE